MRDAKMEAMGLRPEDHEPPKRKQNRMATDDMVTVDFRHDELLLTSVFRSWSVSKSACENEAPPRIGPFSPPIRAGTRALVRHHDGAPRTAEVVA